MMTNFRQWWETNVDVKEQWGGGGGGGGGGAWNRADPTDLTPIYWDNVYFSCNENYESDSRNRYFGNVNASHKIANWVSVLERVSLDSYDELEEERQAVGSVTTSSYSRFNRSYRETNYDLLFNFNKDLSEDLNLKGLLGTNIRRQEHIEQKSSYEWWFDLSAKGLCSFQFVNYTKCPG